MTKHESSVLSKYVNDDNFNMADVAQALGMCRSGAINVIKNLAVEELRVGLINGGYEHL